MLQIKTNKEQEQKRIIIEGIRQLYGSDMPGVIIHNALLDYCDSQRNPDLPGTDYSLELGNSYKFVEQLELLTDLDANTDEIEPNFLAAIKKAIQEYERGIEQKPVEETPKKDSLIGGADTYDETYDRLMWILASEKWAKEHGANYNEALADVFGCDEEAQVIAGIISGNTNPVVVDASGREPKVVNGPVIVATHGGTDNYKMPPNWFTYEGDMYTTLDEMLEKEALGGGPAQRSGRR